MKSALMNSAELPLELKDSQIAAHSRQKRICVAIVDRCVPLYREALYRSLMSDERAEFWIVAPSESIEPMETISPRDDWRWIDAPVCRIFRKISWQWGAVKAGFNRRFDVIIVMAIPYNLGNWGCALAARLTGKRLLMWTHGYTGVDRGLKRLIRWAWYHLAHGLLLYGHTGKNRCIGKGFDPQRCHVIYNSLDLDAQRAARLEVTDRDVREVREQYFGDPTLPIITCITRLQSVRRLDILLEAHKRLLDRGHDAGILIIGDGPMQSELEAQAERLGTRHRIVFFGACYDEAVLARLISACRVCVSPGNLGLTAMHSLAYGVPVITHDDLLHQAPESEAIIPGRTGDFFRKDDPHSLADVILRWLDATHDVEETRRACYEILDRFYTPDLQAGLMVRAALGEPPNDFFAARRQKRHEAMDQA